MKKTPLISATLLLVVSCVLFLVSLNSFKEWRIEKNMKEVRGLEKKLRKTKDDFYFWHSPVLATRIYDIIDDLNVYEKRLNYWQNFNDASPFTSAQKRF